MKIKAHLIVCKGYGLAISASQWIDDLREQTDEHNREYTGDNWRNEEKDRVVITVEFECPNEVFAPLPKPPEIKAKIINNP